MSKSRLPRINTFWFVPFSRVWFEALLLPIAVAASVHASPRFSEPPVSFDKRSSSVAVADPISEPLFGSYVEYGAGNWPYSVAAADLNGDGRIDLAVANGEGDSVSVLLGNGDATFGLATQFAAGDQSRFVAIADFNADGRPDLAVANGISNSVSMLLGAGDGTFGGGIDASTDRNPVSIAIDDLNQDGKLDIATANNDAHSVSILLGKGDGTFQPRTDLDIGTWIASVAIDDLDADGRPDLVVVGHISNRIYVLLGTGGGEFGAKLEFQADWRPEHVAIGDLDADGRPDLVVANWLYGTVSVLRGNGDGTFAAKTDFAAGGGPAAVAVADLDGDSRLDVTVTNSDANTISVLLGDGTGKLGSKSDFGTGRLPLSMAIADFDANGAPDLAVVVPPSSAVSVLLNRGVPAPPVAVVFKFGPSTLNLASRGRWVTGTIAPLPPLSARDIDVASIRLNGTVAVDPSAPTALGDHDGDGVTDLMVKFDRAALELSLPEGDEIPVTVTFASDGQHFAGTDLVRVRRGRVSAPASGDRLSAGSDLQVRWENQRGGHAESVALLLSIDGGIAWTQVAGPRPNTGSIDWTVPDEPTDRARVALVSIAPGEGSGEVADAVLAVSGDFSIAAVAGVGDRGEGMRVLAIRGVTPNPSPHGRLRVEFTLGDGGPARLELLDVAGRVLGMRDVAPMGPGTHSLELWEAGALRPGIYFLRLQQGGSEVRARAAVTR